MHILAYCYHWGRNEVLDIPLRERRMWCKMVRDQIKAEQSSFDKNKDEEDPLSSYSEGY